MRQTLEPNNPSRTAAAPFRPVVIRPTPLRLVSLERRMRSDRRLAEAVRTLPAFRQKLAHALHLHDAAARRRFASTTAVADHLAAMAAD